MWERVAISVPGSAWDRTYPRGSASLLLALLTLLAGCSSRPPYEGKSVAELERMLADGNATVQAQGAYGLALKGPEASSAVPALIKALKTDDVLVREQAARALGEIGPEASSAVPALTEGLSSPPWSAQRQAAIALGRVGPDAKSALATLERLRNDPNRPLRDAVREAIKRIQKT